MAIFIFFEFYKINCNVSWDENSKKLDLEVVVSNEEGVVIHTRVLKIDKIASYYSKTHCFERMY